MVNYACGFNKSETGKYFESIIIRYTKVATVLWPSNMGKGTFSRPSHLFSSKLSRLKLVVRKSGLNYRIYK